MLRSESARTFVAIALLISWTGSAGANPQAGPSFPVKPSSNGRYLVDQGGLPFPILGDAGWSASKNLTSTEVGQYLDDRLARGFNSVLTEAIEHKFTINKPPQDRGGNLPFSRRLDGAAYTGSPNGCSTPNGSNSQFAADPYGNINTQAPDFSYPTLAYWQSLDSFLSACRQRGMLVLLFPAYVGYAGADEGWMGEMVANDAVLGSGGQVGQAFADPTKSRLWNYGAWLADRYKAYPNLIWVHGGDYGNNAGNGGVFTAAQKNAVNNLFAGMKSVPGQQSTLHTAHWSRRSLSSDLSFSAGSFDLEAVYADVSVAQYARSGYANSPVRPAFEIEDYYEGNATGGEPDRRFQWWAELSNIGGYFFGNEKLWPFNSGWASLLNSPGSQDMARLNAFIKGVAWHNLVPSGLGGMKTLVTAGGGTANPQSTDYVAAAATPDGTLFVAYVPPAHSGPLTADLTALSGSARARWFDPTSGTYSSIGSFPNTGTQVFTIPGANSAGANDWLLVLDTALSPTLAQPASASPSTLTGTKTSLGVLGADPGGEASLTYTWSSAGPSAVSFNPNGTNAAKNTTATFSAAGSYTLTVMIRNPGGGTVSSNTSVTVDQTYSSVAVTPPNASVMIHGTQPFTATALDQFGHALATPPAFTWSVSGGGTISGTGLFTAGGTAGGPFTVTAVGGGKSGTAQVTVTSTAPVLTTIQVSPGTALVAPLGTQAFTAQGLDQFGNPMSPQPTFTWTLSGGGTIDSAGVLTAGGSSGGPFAVTASSGSVSGMASVRVAATPSAGGGGSGGGHGQCGLIGLEGLALALLAAWRKKRLGGPSVEKADL
jgi:hypothetical protein